MVQNITNRAVEATLQASDPSEAILVSATAFLDAIYAYSPGDAGLTANVRSANASRTVTPLPVGASSRCSSVMSLSAPPPQKFAAAGTQKHKEEDNYDTKQEPKTDAKTTTHTNPMARLMNVRLVDKSPLFSL
jgi:hypothetical protein